MTKVPQCKVCRHNKRPEIDEAIVLKTMSQAAVAREYGVAPHNITRHKQHLDEALKRRIIAENKQAVAVKEQQDIATVINEDRVEIQGGLKRCLQHLDRILEKAKDDEDAALQLAALKETRQTLIDLAKIYGTLKQSLTVNISLADSPEWHLLRQVLVETFNEHPEAGKAFIQRARRLNVTLAD